MVTLELNFINYKLGLKYTHILTGLQCDFFEWNDDASLYNGEIDSYLIKHLVGKHFKNIDNYHLATYKII